MTVSYSQSEKKTRCTDRFVRYPYPKQMTTNYKIQFEKKQAQPAKEVFNLEKETKYVNLYKLDDLTVNKQAFTG